MDNHIQVGCIEAQQYMVSAVKNSNIEHIIRMHSEQFE